MEQENQGNVINVNAYRSYLEDSRSVNEKHKVKMIDKQENLDYKNRLETMINVSKYNRFGRYPKPECPKCLPNGDAMSNSPSLKQVF
ncbi:hypothetical protein AC249_AIPGENE11275 [Exaiptasia diaphana]|nr:hypothetical protein AC249_AIPGENE11275 [Exaiptasia diaphana]